MGQLDMRKCAQPCHSLPSENRDAFSFMRRLPLGPKEALCYLIHSVPLCSKFAPVTIGGLGASLQLLFLGDFMFL